jgi:hypothetical protein
MSSGNRQLLNPDRRLRAGCYYMHFEPTYPYWGENDPPEDSARQVREYSGTLRVVHYNNEGTRAFSPKETESGQTGEVLNISGDLYARPPGAQVPDCKPIPIFPIPEYRFYLLGTRIEDGERGEFTLFLDSYDFCAGRGNPPCPVTVRLRWGQAPDGSRSAFDFLEGSVWDENHDQIGNLSLKWVSNYLRSGVIEIDRVNDVAMPLNNHSGIEKELSGHVEQIAWSDVFEACGWSMEALISDQPAEPASKIWSEPELHRALPELLDSFDVDHEWRYHIFCVGKLEDTGRGYEFQSEGGEIGSGLFESVVLAAKYEFSGTDSKNRTWGILEGRTLDETPAYFRTAAHEIGHALNLEHNFSTPGFMATTDAVREISEKKATRQGINVLNAIEWKFAPDDLERLRHWPDIVVRPGTKQRPKFTLPGIDVFRFDPLFGGADENAPKIELEFDVKPLCEQVPLGAPVRILLTLTNKGGAPIKVPQLRLKAGNISGRVESRSADVRSFVPLSGPDDDLGLETLDPESSIKGSLTLLSGPDGALFPEPGSHTVTVDLQVYRNGTYFGLSKSTQVWVEPFVDEKQRRVATLLLQSKAALVNFVIGDGLTEGNQAINLALNNPILGPHYAIVALKRLCRNVGLVSGSLDKALLVLAKGQPILTDLEIAGELRKQRPKLTDSAITDLLMNDRIKGDSEIEALRKKREPILTDWELAGLVRAVRYSLGLPSGEEAQATTPKAPIFAPYTLVLDLQYIGTRIVLGEIDQRTLDLFLNGLKQERQAKGGSSALNPTRVKEILRNLLKEKIGLTVEATYELTELLLAHDNKVFKAIQAYDDGDAKGQEKIREAFAEVGLTTGDLKRIKTRVEKILRSSPGVLPAGILLEAGEKILQFVKEINIKEELGFAFLTNLCDNLNKIGIPIAAADIIRARPAESRPQALELGTLSGERRPQSDGDGSGGNGSGASHHYSSVDPQKSEPTDAIAKP